MCTNNCDESTLAHNSDRIKKKIEKLKLGWPEGPKALPNIKYAH